MDWEQFSKDANADMVWKKGEPSEYEKVFRSLAGKEGINRNWLESEAYRAGVDFDQIRGYDDGECPKKFSNLEDN